MVVWHQILAQSFVNPSFEAWGVANTCEINKSPDGWSDYSVACAELDEANFPLCPTTIPPNASNGNIYARACAGPDWQGGEGIFQNVTGFSVGTLYTLSFDYAGSNLYGGSDSVRWKVYIDDTLITQTPFFSSSKNTWSTFSHSFVPMQSMHRIGVRAYFINPTVTGTGSAGLDNFSLFKHGEETSIEENLGDNKIEIYPTLMENYLHVKSQNQEELEVLVYDINAIVKHREKFRGFATISVENLAAGVYFCMIKNKNKLVSRQAMMKR